MPPLKVRRGQSADAITAKRGEPRIRAHASIFASRDWHAMAENADRRCLQQRSSPGGRTEDSGRGRDSVIAKCPHSPRSGQAHNFAATLRPVAATSFSAVAPSGHDQRPEAFRTDVLNVAQIKADGQIAALVTFDPDDIDAAFAELEERYVAGEAAAHSHTWSLIARAYAGFNRGEIPAATPGLGERRPSARGRNGTG